jgi:hypothetical protein
MDILIIELNTLFLNKIKVLSIFFIKSYLLLSLPSLIEYHKIIDYPVIFIRCKVVDQEGSNLAFLEEGPASLGS